MSLIHILVNIFYLYLLIGFLFGLWFVFSGVHKVDAGMRSGGIILRLLIFPASAALWPILLGKWLRTKK